MADCPGLGPPGVDIFSQCSSVPVNFENIYCCPGLENKFIGYDPLFDPDLLFVAAPSCVNFTFPIKNDENVPMLKSALNGTAQSPWIRVAFQQYCQAGQRSIAATNQTIITTGNISQLGGEGAEKCTASIKSFQYGWGTVDSGNRCRITIVDEEGGGFETWARRMATNAEAASAPVKGTYKMKVQWGWYLTGGGPNDQCGQGAADPPPTGDNLPNPPPGQNTSYNICSPTLWFLPDAITVNWENGKFMYTLEGVDLLVRGQEQRLNRVFGTDGGDDNPFNKPMYFTEAVRLLGVYSMPPFRPRFLSIDANGKLVSMKFKERQGPLLDSPCKGPFAQYSTSEEAPLDIIRRWVNDWSVTAIDQTGNIQTPDKKIGITFNYDSTLDLTSASGQFPVDKCEEEVQECLTAKTCCDPRFPEVGSLILWASNGVPHCQSNVVNIDSRMKAVYVVNGGNCVNGSSLILTEDGWQRINNIVKNKYNGKVACLNQDNEFTWSRINNWYRNKINDRKLIKVHLHNSRQRKGSISGAIFTEDHPILTDKGYIEVKDLNLLKHKINSGTYQPSKEIHQAVLGMILGDGCIRRKSYSFHCAHSEKQRAYIEHKASLFGLNVIDKPTRKYPTVKTTSKSSPYWRSLRRLFYPNGTKTINKEILKYFSITSLAYLFMDDGHLKLNKKLAEIATCGFTKEEVDLLVDKIHELGIKCYRRKSGKYPRIYFSVEQTRILSEKIAPYVIESMNYKILDQHRFIKKIQLNTKQEIFYDTFDLIRCDKLEKITKLVYCIDVEDHHNFITHSGVVHNCSPVIAFNPVVRWHFLLGLKAGGVSVPITGKMSKQTEGLVRTECNIVGARSAVTQNNPGAPVVGTINNPGPQTAEARVLHTAGNLMVHAIEAELRVQGDPSPWLCSPIAGFGRCIGIIFINPFFLREDALEGNCPAFKQTTTSVCNNFLTNKGWFIKGVEHQIKEGSYITTIKVVLPAPGAELKFSDGSTITGLGGTAAGAKMYFGGTNATIRQYPCGLNAGTWIDKLYPPPAPDCPIVCYQGGGSGVQPPTIDCPPPVGGV
jgi:hypothetical protein